MNISRHIRGRTLVAVQVPAYTKLSRLFTTGLVKTVIPLGLRLRTSPRNGCLSNARHVSSFQEEAALAKETTAPNPLDVHTFGLNTNTQAFLAVKLGPHLLKVCQPNQGPTLF